MARVVRSRGRGRGEQVKGRPAHSVKRLAPEPAPSALRVATVTLSTKHQLTLPVDMVRALGLEPGQKYVIANEEGRIVLYPDKHSRTDYFAGSLGGVYGKTKEDVDAYLAEVRGDWGTADQEAPFEKH